MNTKGKQTIEGDKRSMSINGRKLQLEERKRKQETHTNQSTKVDEAHITKRGLSNHQKIAKDKKDCSHLPILFFILFVSPPDYSSSKAFNLLL